MSAFILGVWPIAGLTSGRSHLIGVSRLNGKAPHSRVDYRAGDPKGKHCAVYFNFIEPKSCKVVDDPISPSGLCDWYEPKDVRKAER